MAYKERKGSRSTMSKDMRGDKYGRRKNHEAAVEAKAEIRANVLEEMQRLVQKTVYGAMSGARISVFDAFGGTGEMYRRVWSKADYYEACDLEWSRDARRVYVADNKQVLRSIPLEWFNIFDLDAYGSPWEQAMIIAARRTWTPGEHIGLLLTYGIGMKLSLGGLPRADAILADMAMDFRDYHSRELVYERCLGGFLRRTGAEIVRQWRTAAKGHAGCLYGGLVLRVAR